MEKSDLIKKIDLLKISLLSLFLSIAIRPTFNCIFSLGYEWRGFGSHPIRRDLPSPGVSSDRLSQESAAAHLQRRTFLGPGHDAVKQPVEHHRAAAW